MSSLSPDDGEFFKLSSKEDQALADQAKRVKKAYDDLRSTGVKAQTNLEECKKGRDRVDREGEAATSDADKKLRVSLMQSIIQAQAQARATSPANSSRPKAEPEPSTSVRSSSSAATSNFASRKSY